MTGQIDPDVIATYERVYALINSRSSNDKHMMSRDRDEYIVASALKKKDAVLLSLFEKHLSLDCEYSLDDIMGAYQTFQHCKIDSPGERVTVQAARIYQRVVDVICWAAEEREGVSDRSLLCAAMLHGEATEADIGLMESVVRERMPLDGAEFVSLLEQARSVSSPSLSSGVL